MKRWSPLLVLMIGSLPLARGQPVPLFENFGVITGAPEIDALAFANYGTFSVGTFLPFDFQNTVNFTNTGTMSGSPGFQFDTAFSNQKRQMAASLFNRTGASITALDFPLGLITINGQPFQTQLIFPSFLLISATNVESSGVMTVGSGGRLKLEGKNVNLSRGGLNVESISGTGISTGIAPIFTNFFVPELGIFDNWWGGVTNLTIDSSSIVGAGFVVTPPHPVTNIFGSGFVQFGILNPFSFAYTNKFTDTNWSVQVAFVGPPPTMGVRASFARSRIITNLLKTVVVELSLPVTNVVTGTIQPETLYFTDRLASDTNYLCWQNFIANPPTFRPAIYDVGRNPTAEFFFGVPANSQFDPATIYNGSYSNAVVTNIYAGYSAQIEYTPITPPPVQGLNITNQPGRIEIQASELNMERTRIRGNSFVSISTDHLVSSSNALVDAPHLSFDLASTNGNLRVKDLARDSVDRLSGLIYAWSGIWTNYTGMLATNQVDDGMGGFTNQVVTNVVEVGIHVLILDATALTTAQPVLTHVFHNRSTNIVLGDSIQVVDSFLLDGQSFTLTGGLRLSGAVSYWTGTNAPALQYFTNQGTLTVDNAATFGNDRTNAYTAIVNSGTMTGPSYSFSSDYFENAGAINPNARLTIVAREIKFQRGGSISGNDVTFEADDVKLLGSAITTRGGFIVVVTNSLADAGLAATNLWTCQNGFSLPIKPKFGDLFGTTVQSTPATFALASHTWAASDGGASPAAFKDNAVIGRLVLNASPQSFLQFDAASANGNALYVDFLDLEGPVQDAFNSDDLASVIGIGPGFVIYFADSNVSAEKLDGQIDGRIRWVKDFAGPNSSVDVLRLNGQTVKMNRALRFSTTIDSDGDGVANAFDFYPLDDAEWNGTLPGSGFWTGVSVNNAGASRTVSLSWNATPGSVYHLEYTTNLSSPSWQPLMSYTNVAVANGVVTILDQNLPPGETQRYYRARYGR